VATLEQLEQGVRKAYEVGNMEYARILGAELVRARGDRVNQIPDMTVAPPPRQEPGFVDKAIGTGEAALAVATGATSGAIGLLAGGAKGVAQSILAGEFGTKEAAKMVEDAAMGGARALTYAPRTESGQDQAQVAGEALGSLPPVLPLAPQISAATRIAAPAVASGAQSGTQAVARGARAITEPPQQVRPQAGIGAEAAAPATLRAAKAEGLPVPVNLTAGARTRDAAQLAFEKE
jgi:hypothetical protein